MMNEAIAGHGHVHRWTWVATVMLAVTMSLPALAAGAVALVEDGTARALIIVPAEPEAEEQLAAEELAEHVEAITGVELTIEHATADELDGTLRTLRDADLTPVILGCLALDEELAAAVREADAQEQRPMGLDSGAFGLWVDASAVRLAGLTAEGTLFGVYELLEQQGVRWYMPGELGTVIPVASSVRLERQRTEQAPSFAYRRLTNLDGAWPQRVRLGGERRTTGSHNIPPFRGATARRLFEADPEYFALVDGERRQRQLCVSNPEVLERTIEAVRARLEAEPRLEHSGIGMGPADGHGYCECEQCRALDGEVHDPFHDAVSLTDRYIWFFNELLDALEADYPDLHIAWYVYSRHMMPPQRVEPNPRIIQVFAPIALDRIRGMNNPMSPDRHVLRWLIDRWSELEPNHMYYRGYYYNLACPQFPFSHIDRIRTETPAFYERGFTAMRVETRPSWSVHTPSLYLASRMMWDVDTDVDALLAEFYEKLYGPASEPMARYHEALDAAFRDTPYFAGSSYPYFPIFDARRRDTMRGHLDEALRLADSADATIYAERLWAIRIGWDRLERFLDMIEARNRHDFAAAHDKLEQVRELGDEMAHHVLEEVDTRDRWIPRLLEWRENSERGGAFINRFFASAIEDGYVRTVEQGELVAALPDQWQFLLDPARIGEIAGYHRPGELGGNWQTIKTVSRTWSDQGLHYSRAPAWYRTEVTVPERFRGRPLYLWFGGVHRQATVWVNGQSLGTSDEPDGGLPGVPGSFRPFDMDATEALRVGSNETNTIVVRIVHDTPQLGELGLRGIIAPAMLWSPADPQWTPW